MLLDWVLLCDSYRLHDGGSADIYEASFDTIHVEQLPADIDLTLLCRLLLGEDEQAELELHVLGPGTAPLGSLAYEIAADPRPNHRPGYIVSQIEAIDVGFAAEEPGVYSIELFVNAPRGDPTAYERRRSIFFSVVEGVPSD